LAGARPGRVAHGRLRPSGRSGVLRRRRVRLAGRARHRGPGGRLRGVGGSAGTAPDGVCGLAVGAAIAWPRHQIQPEEFRAVTDVFAPVTKSSEYADQASAAYRAALSVIERVEPRIADATRAELADQRA